MRMSKSKGSVSVETVRERQTGNKTGKAPIEDGVLSH